MIYQVSGADLKTIRLNDQDAVSSVLHNVALILATPKGTVPMYRDFGLDREFLDMPVTEAEVRIGGFHTKPLLWASISFAVFCSEKFQGSGFYAGFPLPFPHGMC